MKRNLIIPLVYILLCLFSTACSDKQKEDFSKYISAYTDGIVRSSSPIQIQLAIKPDKDFQAGTTLPAKILQVSPEIKGDLSLKDGEMVEFIPAEPLKNGQEYQVKFDLGALCSVPEKYKEFTFRFKVIELGLKFKEGDLWVQERNDSILMYQAEVFSSDYIAPDVIEKKISATLDGNNMPLTWTHDNNIHRFTVKDLRKGEQGKTLTLSFSKDFSKNDKTTVEIPSLHEFIVLNAKPVKSERLIIRVTMSERVAASQNLDGFIMVDRRPCNNFEIEDNTIILYPDVDKGTTGLVQLYMFKGIKSASGDILNSDFKTDIRLSSADPRVSFIGKGVIVPDQNKVIIPFSAVALKAVDIEIIKVLNQNMNFFLQENNYEGSYELRRTARPVFTKKIDLQQEYPDIDLNRWNDFTIDLSRLVKLEKGVIYRIKLKFKKSYTTLECAGEAPDSEFSASDWDNPGYYSDYEYPIGYEWEEADNPCHVSYYNGDRFASKNIINTALGVLAKRAVDNKFFISVNELNTASPVSDCDIFLYDFQNQKIDSARTDKNGFAYASPKSKAFIILAKKGDDQAWLKVSDGNALSLSNFDVSGQNVQMGVKGFIYGERGVWRPGDEIYLSLILEDKLKMLPEGHPITAQLIDPKGNVIQSKNGKTGECNIYCFKFKTPEDAPTGYWHAVFRIGGISFTKTLRIETIKPNRLSIVMQFPNDQVIGKGISTAPVKVKTQWLHGAKTPNLKAITEVKLNKGNGSFSTYPDYTFADKSKDFTSNTEVLFDGTTDANGDFSFSIDKIKSEDAPGLLNATFTTRVFENGGDFSIVSQSIAYSPYTEYVGIRLPDSEDRWFSTQKPLKINGVTVTPKGEKSGNSIVEIEVYKLNWRWWWDSEYDNIGSYVNREYNREYLRKNVQVTNGSFTTNLGISESGRYFIKAVDKSGHTTGMIAYFGSWGDIENSDAATILNVSTDKKTYKAGEKIKIKIPSSEGGVAIVSLETGQTVKDIFRIPATKGSTTIEVEATPEMCPNVYASVTLIQPHNNRDNDRPIRLYGVVNVNVEDQALHLNPEIKIAPELRPAEEFTVSVHEKNGKPMNYTIAIVDEGLLSLTAFKTPSPFGVFYAREALGVKTWDFYDFIYGAYGARLDKAFAVGGDESLKNLQDEKTNRFKPVVLFEGPFTLKKGATQTHHFRMPEYIGEVRTMVIAATNGQYGEASVNTQVKQPLMVSLAMPRLFTPGDIIDIPVTVFALNKNIREATVSITTDNKITVSGSSSQTVIFNGQGEQVVYFKVRINDLLGMSTIRIDARSGNEKAYVLEDVEIRIPNPRITKVEEKELKAGESISFSATVKGADPVSTLEVSSIPPLNLEQRLSYLIDYPHGCAEQITSKAFPQLALGNLMTLTAKEKAQVETNVKEVINRLRAYQTADGGFAYWQGSPNISDWVSTYIAQFLVTAEQQGYSVPKQMLQGDLNYMKKIANNWHPADPYAQMEQAYRLYVLALANQPDLGAMNRLRESRLTENTAQWLLASAYVLCNQKQVGEKIVRQLSSEVSPYRQTGRCFGSDTRDYAIILQAMVNLGMQQDAYRMLQKISKAMGSGNWYSTQETAFALNAAAAYVSKFLGSQNGINITVKTAEGKETIDTEKTIYQQNLKIRDQKTTVEIKNNGKGNLYARQINSSIPFDIVTEKIMSGLLLSVNYYGTNGNPLDINRLQQGTDVIAEITVKNTGNTGEYQELVLSYLLPSGFEIINERLTGNANAFKEAENVDIRDDRFYVYFDLGQNQSKTFKFRFNAAFAGEYIQPAITCTAMYDNSIEGILPGGKITITK